MKNKTIEKMWHVQLTVAAVIALQLLLGNQFSVGPKYSLAALELVLLIGLSVSAKSNHDRSAKIRRLFSLGLIACITVLNMASLILLLDKLLLGGIREGHTLLYSAGSIYITNIILFGLWYWELDGGGPDKRLNGSKNRDFLFVQQNNPAGTSGNWQPLFFDYVYTSSTNATAFSPTDTMPLSHRAKAFMLVQSLISLLAVGLVIARAVNILS
jgi:hypothetical protein